jgi:hypothetical protein
MAVTPAIEDHRHVMASKPVVPPQLHDQEMAGSMWIDAFPVPALGDGFQQIVAVDDDAH